MASAQLMRCGRRMDATTAGMPSFTSGKPELGPVAGNDEIAPGGQGESVAEAVAVHRRDDRLEDLPATLEGVQGRLLPERAGERTGRSGPVAEVPAGAEGASSARHDGHPGVLVVAEASEGRIQVPPHFAVDGVERVGPVVGDRGHVAVELEGHCVAHRTSLPGRSRSARVPGVVPVPGAAVACPVRHRL